jgi:hypothetical protein
MTPSRTLRNAVVDNNHQKSSRINSQSLVLGMVPLVITSLLREAQLPMLAEPLPPVREDSSMHRSRENAFA